jgi:NADH:ubiquinone oxidoreductase subunit C
MSNIITGNRSTLVKVWVLYLNGVLPFLKTTLGNTPKKLKVISGFEIEVETTSKYFYPFVFFLNRHSLCLFNLLVDVACYDCPGKLYRFSLVYNLLSVKFNFRLRLIVKHNDPKSKALSLTSLFRSAG